MPRGGGASNEAVNERSRSVKSRRRSSGRRSLSRSRGGLGSSMQIAGKTAKKKKKKKVTY